MQKWPNCLNIEPPLPGYLPVKFPIQRHSYRQQPVAEASGEFAASVLANDNNPFTQICKGLLAHASLPSTLLENSSTVAKTVLYPYSGIVYVYRHSSSRSFFKFHHRLSPCFWLTQTVPSKRNQVNTLDSFCLPSLIYLAILSASDFLLSP